MNTQAMLKWLLGMLKTNPQMVITVLELLLDYLKKNPAAVKELVEVIEKGQGPGNSAALPASAGRRSPRVQRAARRTSQRNRKS